MRMNANSYNAQTSNGQAGFFSKILHPENLESAWDHVRVKHGGPGLDRETVEMIEAHSSGVLEEIRQQVWDGAYRPGNLLTFEKAKSSGGTREITICNLRDRILSRAISQVLVQRYNGVLVPQCYAYRPNRGAIKAVRAIQHACGKANYAVRADFEKFFDSMDHTLLADRLTSLGVPEEVQELVMRFVRAPRFDGSATYHPRAGVPQGSPLSPVLANLYLNPFDHALEETHPRFVRYADDVVVLTGDVAAAQEGYKRLNALAEESQLHLSTAKTRIMRVEDGFLFLGFVFNRNGHSASREARERLAEKLGEAPRDDELPEETQKRRESIVRGWSNYFGNEDSSETQRSVNDVTHKPMADAMEKAMEDAMKDAMDKATGKTTDKMTDKAKDKAASEPAAGGAAAAHRLSELRRSLACGDIAPGESVYAERLVELAAEYEALGLTAAGRACREEAGQEPGSASEPVGRVECVGDALDHWLAKLNRNELTWRQGTADRLGRVSYQVREGTLTRTELERHLAGELTVSVPVFRNAELVWCGVVDLDITRKNLEAMGRREREAALEGLRVDAMGIAQRAGKAGIHPLVESSGYKGYHLWFLADQPLPAREMVDFLQELLRISGEPPPGTHREMFPASAKSGNEGLQTHVKWLMGVHPLTGRRGVLLDGQGNPLGRDVLPDPGLVAAPLAAFRAAVNGWRKYAKPEMPEKRVAKPTVETAAPPRDATRLLRRRCGVLDALCRKAEVEGDLTHPERLVVRGILHPLGKETGRRAVHEVIRHCGNYDPAKTDGFLKDSPDKPMACGRIREILGDFCEHAGCNCQFRKLKKNYNHPLRHLRKQKGPRKHESPKDVREVEANHESPGVCAKGCGADPRMHDGTSAGVKLEILKAYHEARDRAVALSKALDAAVAESGNDCTLGQVVRGGADPELPIWRIEL